MNVKVAKKQFYFAKKRLFLKLVFRDVGHLYANCLFYFLAIYCKCLLFQFLGCGIGMYIQNRGISRWKNGQILMKTVLLEFNFQDEDPLYAICLFYILAI